jgi:hypothetical protein
METSSFDSSDKSNFSVHSISSLLKGDTGSFMKEDNIPDIAPLAMNRSSHSFKDSLNSSVNQERHIPVHRPPILKKKNTFKEIEEES